MFRSLLLFVGGFLLFGCGSGLFVGRLVRFEGFPTGAGYETGTGFLTGSFRVVASGAVTVTVAMDESAPVTADTTRSGNLVKWKAALPNRLASPVQWNIGTRHTAVVTVALADGRFLGQGQGAFRVGLNRDANRDGFPDLLFSASDADEYSVDSGAAYIYTSAAGNFSAENYLKLVDPSAEASVGLGLNAQLAGDFNADGYADAFFSLHNSSFTGTNRGGAYVAYGSSAGLQTSSLARLTCSACVNGTRAGAGGTISDFNSDGYDDLLLGGVRDRAFLYLGGPAGLSLTESQVFSQPSGDVSSLFGRYVRGIPDANGDSFPDALVGAVLSDATGSVDAGAAYLFYGSLGGINPTPTTFFPDPVVPGDNFGRQIFPLGDLNGDGLSEFSVSPQFDGIVRIFRGTAGPVNTTPSLIFPSTPGALGTRFGVGIAPIGDINSDGFEDVAFGSPGIGTETDFSGEVFFLLGNQALESLSVHSRIGYPNADYGARFGRALCSLDINSDGLLDLVVGVPEADGVASDSGAVFLYLRSGSGFQLSTVLAYPGVDTYPVFGSNFCGTQ